MQMQVDSAKIKKLRDANCWSQEHLADASGVSLRTIQRLENGDSVSQDTVMAIAAAFDVDIDELVAKKSARTFYHELPRRNIKSAILGFKIHLATYIGVVALLLIVNIVSGRPDWWITWPAMGWGSGVLAHGVAVFLATRFWPGGVMSDALAK